MERDAGDGADQPIRDSRRQLATDFVVVSILAPAAHHVIALEAPTPLELLQKSADVGGIVLKVSVHGDDYRPPRSFYPGGNCGGLPKVAPETDHVKQGLVRSNARKGGKRAISTAVIHRDDFVAPAQPSKHTKQ